MWVRIKENHCRRDVISSDPVMVFCIRRVKYKYVEVIFPVRVSSLTLGNKSEKQWN